MKIKPGAAVKIAALVFLGNAALLSAQTAAEVEALLSVKEITWVEAAYFTLGSSREGVPVNGQGPQRQTAFQFVRERGWIPENAGAEEKAALGGLSLLMMRSFNIPGGLMYRLFHNARYAYREMQARGFLRARSYPANRVSGAEFLQILGELLSYTGDPEALEGAAVLPEYGRDSPQDNAAAVLPEDGRDNAGEFHGLSTGSEAVKKYEGKFEPE